MTKVQLVFESYDEIKKGWSEVPTKNLAVQNTHFAEGGFRNAFLATQSCQDCISSKWDLKKYKEDEMKPVPSHLGMTIDQHARKQVQMHSAASAITQNINEEVTSSIWEIILLQQSIVFHNGRLTCHNGKCTC